MLSSDDSHVFCSSMLTLSACCQTNRFLYLKSRVRASLSLVEIRCNFLSLWQDERIRLGDTLLIAGNLSLRITRSWRRWTPGYQYWFANVAASNLASGPVMVRCSDCRQGFALWVSQNAMRKFWDQNGFNSAFGRTVLAIPELTLCWDILSLLVVLSPALQLHLGKFRVW
jgi:hypothetical protein